MNGRERCLAAIRGEPVDRVPVFPLLMFFSADRAGITYREYATSGPATAASQLLVRERFPVDAITACSDAFRVSADLGGEMAYPEDRPPHLVRPIVETASDLDGLGRPDPSAKGSRMADRAEAVRIMAEASGDECLVLGWVDMPFAEACSVCGVSEFMMMMVDEPELARRLLEFLTGVVIDFALHQTESGGEMIGAGDAAASLVSPAMYREFALPYEQRVCEAVHAKGGLVKLHICGNTTGHLKDMTRSGADLYNVDHLVDFSLAADVYGDAALCFKGNLDPVADMLQATPEQCQERALERLRLAEGRRFMLSPGCEVPAGCTDEVFRAFCEAPARYAERRGNGI